MVQANLRWLGKNDSYIVCFFWLFFNDYHLNQYREIEFEGVIASADSYFIQNGNYKYEPSKINDAHKYSKQTGFHFYLSILFYWFIN